MIKIDLSNALTPDLKKQLEANTAVTTFDPPPFAEFDDKTLDKVDKFYKSSEFDFFVHIGIGGSCLGAKAIVRAIGNKSKTKFFFLDNIDPETTSEVLDSIKPARTLFYIVSKTGSTLETVSAFLIALKRIKNVSKNVVIATDPSSGYLREFAKENKTTAFDIPPQIGGRFSTLTPVGLVPARFCGADIHKIIDGAKSALKQSVLKDYPLNVAYSFAATSHFFYKQAKNILVFMTYSEALDTLVDLFCQLWAESLGKEGKGQTPLKARGATDQHSLIQLLNEGPNDKLTAFLQVLGPRRDLVVPKDSNDFKHIAGKTLGEILSCEKRGTEQALAKLGRPNFTIDIDTISEKSIGELIMTLEMATLFEAKLLGVNPFNQPGVEEGKRLALKMLKS